uniref:Large ribosomal subunit protein bL12c n=1 Tax=Toxarium undulatum TaxID=210620 RepID=A0A1D8D9G3_9STRA|nr:ribosomal protein L12 [Toxarium undulatum]AOS86585.1 ribosomal protein L12 [Toxarium undulatum]
MSEKIDSIIEELKTLTLLEASELVTRIEETFGVEASVNVSNGMLMGAPVNLGGETTAEVVEEKTEFNIMLEEVPADKKIPVLKIVRSLTGLGLKEAKELVESAPKQIQEGLNKEAAEDAQKQLETAGAKISLT